MSEITLYDESSQAHVRITLVSAGTVDGKGNLSWLDKSFVFWNLQLFTENSITWLIFLQKVNSWSPFCMSQSVNRLSGGISSMQDGLS